MRLTTAGVTPAPRPFRRSYSRRIGDPGLSLPAVTGITAFGFLRGESNSMTILSYQGSKLGVVAILAGSLLSLAIPAQETIPVKGGDANLKNGKALYDLHCQYCHGNDGDRVDCIEIVPLVGLGRRPRVDLVGQVLSKSYFFRGVSYEGEDARDLSAFLLSLKGEKGFDDPGLRISLSVLGHRYGLLNQYRAIDLRDAPAYAKGHIPNAQSWPTGKESGGDRPRTAELVWQKLGVLAVSPAMTIVVYDDSTTPAAAQLWWDLVRAGHRNVAILDGGFRDWVREDNEVSTVVTPLAPLSYVSQEAGGVGTAGRNYPVLHLRTGLQEPSSGVFDWEHTVTDGQLRTAAEIREYLKRVEISVPGTYLVDGNDAEASYVVYLLRLLGHQGASYDPVSKVLIADK
jgi:rhodanese-related sulfurtransferase